jgi:hypothetical protein
MKKSKMIIFRSLMFCLAMIVFSSCHDEPTQPSQTAQSGSAKITIVVNKVGVLSKPARNADISLVMLFITLSTTGEESINDTIPLPHDGSTTVTGTYNDLAANKKWTVSARSSDLNDSTIHSGSIKFTVLPNQRTAVTLDLTAKYSILIAKFYPIQDSVNRVQILLDGSSIADSSFPKQTLVGDTVMLKYDYLTTATTHTILFNVFGDYGGSGILLYQGAYTLTAVPGENLSCSVPLNWVGPIIRPAGGGDFTVLMGTVGRILVKGEFGGTTTKEPTKVSGSISGNAHWTPSGSPYLLTEKVTVSALSTLTIDSGVIVNGQNFSLESSGTSPDRRLGKCKGDYQ